MSKTQPAINVGSALFEAIQTAYDEDIWPSAKNIAILLGYKKGKLRGDDNRLRKRILKEYFFLG